MHPLKGLQPLPPSREQRDNGIKSSEHGKVFISSNFHSNQTAQFSIQLLGTWKIFKIAYRIVCATPSGNAFFDKLKKQYKYDLYISFFESVIGKLRSTETRRGLLIGTDGFPIGDGSEFAFTKPIPDLFTFGVLARREFKYRNFKEKDVKDTFSSGKQLIVIAIAAVGYKTISTAMLNPTKTLRDE